MPRYVDLDKLPLVNIDVDTINGGAFVDLREVQQALRQAEAQTGEVAPVVHGEWIDTVDVDGTRWQYCSRCNHTRFGRTKINYCPHCGAKMDGKVDWNECCPMIPREEDKEKNEREGARTLDVQTPQAGRLETQKRN